MAKAPKQKKESDIEVMSVMSAVDNKNYKWFDTLNEAQKSKFSSWVYMRWASSVNAKEPLMTAYYLQAINEKVNKHFNRFGKHPKLQYLLMASASPGFGKQYHQWIAPGKRGSTPKVRKLLEQLYPNANDQELELLESTNELDDIVQHLMDRGWTDKEIKEALVD